LREDAFAEVSMERWHCARTTHERHQAEKEQHFEPFINATARSSSHPFDAGTARLPRHLGSRRLRRPAPATAFPSPARNTASRADDDSRQAIVECDAARSGRSETDLATTRDGAGPFTRRGGGLAGFSIEDSTGALDHPLRARARGRSESALRLRLCGRCHSIPLTGRTENFLVGRP